MSPERVLARERPEVPHSARAVRTAGIVGLGIALPERRVPNEELHAKLGVSDEWIRRRTGIGERRYVAPEQRVSDLASAAGREALRDAGLDASDLDLVLVATVASDELTPNTAPIVAHELGAGNAAAMDVGAACAGAIAGLAHATTWIESGRARNALVIGAEVLTRMINWEDPRTAPLFGDGAGAIVLRADADGLIGPIVLGSDGGAAHAIRATREKGVLEMDGHDTFVMAVERFSQSTREVVAMAELELGDIDLFVFHQANGRILSAVAERLGVPGELVYDCIGELGNTSAASVPLALHRAVAAGLIKPGARVVLGAVGAGLVWGATLVTWGDS